ncbi:MAG: SNF2-related protein [Dehalococcoidia bacterium]|nr:SNF2-related protein [Dehalococcoidia bacterium]
MYCPAPDQAGDCVSLVIASFVETGGGTVALGNVLADEEPLILNNEKAGTEKRLAAGSKQAISSGPRERGEAPLAKRLAYLLQPPAELLASPLGPLEWNGTLFPYQLEGVQALLSRGELLLADDMGLGKTIQAIAALRVLAIQRRVETALVVLPASLLSQWRAEIRRWAPELRISTVHGPADERAYQWSAPAHVFLTTYETLRADFTNNPASPPRRKTWGVVILDEAQKIKNPDAEVSQKCKALPRKRAWALTGTPLENCLDDLASILEFVTPLAPGDRPVRLRADSAMLERHRGVQLRRKKSQVLKDLPPKTVTRVMLALTDSQRAAYQAAEERGVLKLKSMGEEVRIENVLELILRLKQLCNFCPETGRSAKLDDVRDRVAVLQAEGHRALIFSQFTDQQFGVAAIASKLAEFQPLSYTGGSSMQQRQATIRTFKSDSSHKLLVLSLRAGGQGLNLQEASYVFHFDRWWNPAVEQQAEGRSHRMGQSFPVHIYKYTCEGTIEDRIDSILRDKQLLFDEIVDDVSIDLRTRLGAEELFGLFGLQPPKSTKETLKQGLVLPDFSRMSGVEFEAFVKNLLERRHWTVHATHVTRDGGVDLIAKRAVDIGAELTLYIQCKNHVSPVGVETVRQLSGVLPRTQAGFRGVVVCPAGFTADSVAFAQQRNLILWDRSHLFELAGDA